MSIHHHHFLSFLLRSRGASSSHLALQPNKQQFTIFVWSTSLTPHSISSVWEAICFPCTCSLLVLFMLIDLLQLLPFLHRLLAAFSGPSSSTSSSTSLAVIEGIAVACYCWCVTDAVGVFFTAHNSRSVPKDQRAMADTAPPSALPCVFTLSFAFSPCCQEQSSVHLLPHQQASVSGKVIRGSVFGWFLVVNLLVSVWVSFLCCLVQW